MTETELWRGELGRKWADNHIQFDQMLAVLNPPLLEHLDAEHLDTSLQIREDISVLDIGCGSGALTLEASKRTGMVTGVDLSEDMLKVARERVRLAGVDNVEFVLSDMDSYVPERRFDLIISRLGVMFFVDPASSFAHIRGMAAPDGRLVFICWQAMRRNLWALLPYECALAVSGVEPPPPSPTGPFAFADPTLIKHVLSAGGWRNICIDPVSMQLPMPGDDPDRCAAFAIGFGPASRLVKEFDLDAAAIVAALADKLRAGEDMRTAAAWLVSAQA